MRNRIVLSLMALLTAATAGADPIHYEQIPADVTAYCHADVDRYLASQFGREYGQAAMAEAMIKTQLGGPLQSVTFYSLGSGDGVNLVVLAHVTLDPKLRQKEVDGITGKKDGVQFSYEGQTVYYCSTGLISVSRPTDRRPVRAAVPPVKSRYPMRLELGLGNESGKFNNLFQGPSYIAFAGQDMFVFATDLPSMAEALDVLAGRKPSLASKDAQGLKVDEPPGVVFSGSGCTAEWEGDNTDGNDNPSDNAPGGTTRPVKIADSGPGGFGLNMFGAFKGKARLARIDLGENGDSEFVDASFAMTDSDSAEQLKNLVLGVKALVSLSNAKYKPLIDPLDVQTDGKTVSLHWAWPTAKLEDLFHRPPGESEHDIAAPTTSPAAP